MSDARPVEPLDGPLDAVVVLPGSKSITNRALVAAALAPGRSHLDGVLVADDTEAMLGALRALGYDLDLDASAARVEIEGGALTSTPARLDARQSGTTARFVLPLAATTAATVRVDGHPQLRRRPMAPTLAALRTLGARVGEVGAPGQLPVDVTGPIVGGRTLALPADASSQFASGLMLVAPALAGGLTLELEGDVVSGPYLALTAAVMEAFGADVGIAGPTITVAPTGYRPTHYAVEPDASAASYFMAAAAITGGRVTIEGVGHRPLQGDWAFADVLAAMGATVERAGGRLTVTGSGALHGLDVDLRALSDTAPTLAVVAAFAEGPTRVTGIGFIRAKETDRITAVTTELRRMGVDAGEDPDGFSVRPDDGGGGLHGARIVTYDDHRMAMSFAIAGLRVPGIEIADPGCVAKTFPGFWDALDRLRRERGGLGSRPR